MHVFDAAALVETSQRGNTWGLIRPLYRPTSVDRSCSWGVRRFGDSQRRASLTTRLIQTDYTLSQYCASVEDEGDTLPSTYF